MDKRGSIALSLGTLVGAILLIVFLLAGIAIFRPLYSSDFQFGMQEQVCRTTLAISKYFDFPGVDRPITPLCKALVISFSKQEINSFTTNDETLKDATMRYLADKMRRCAKIYNFESREGVAQHSYCHICYALQADRKDPLNEDVDFTPEEFTSALLSMQTSSGKNYFRELTQGELSYALKLKTKTLDLQKTDYAIFYLDNVKSADWPIFAGGGVGALCTIGLVAGLITGGIGTIVCGAGAVTGWVVGIFSAANQFTETNLDAVFVTELTEARAYCTEIISS